MAKWPGDEALSNRTTLTAAASVAASVLLLLLNFWTGNGVATSVRFHTHGARMWGGGCGKWRSNQTRPDQSWLLWHGHVAGNVNLSLLNSSATGGPLDSYIFRDSTCCTHRNTESALISGSCARCWLFRLPAKNFPFAF